MRSLRVKLAIGVAALGVVVITAAAVAGDRGKIRTSLTGYEEVPAISTTGNGSFRASLNSAGTELLFVLRYADLESDATQAHIHFAQKAVNGGISAWLCGTPAAPGPAGTPTCPGARAGTISGTITAADVVGPNSGNFVQGIDAGEFDELVNALRAGVAYANVHTTGHPAGEIRGQLDNQKRGHDDH
jgi:CHRD domain-containing protein